ncbi:hypothetical protein PROFUN_07057 [Planoprotostelium fungivorum]|uniref:Uncharacterized protein n=1 Tax=Planoprotostelium fungivorum TaxID=1890364 RepID=A0A2P6NN35_9EUKA|nr:hypothetical protein PROFUN_07057 [Planoprotostelium fungivorum]
MITIILLKVSNCVIMCLVNLGGGITINISAGLLQNAVQSNKQSTNKEKASASTNLAGAITLTREATIATAAYTIHATQHADNSTNPLNFLDTPGHKVFVSLLVSSGMCVTLKFFSTLQQCRETKHNIIATQQQVEPLDQILLTCSTGTSKDIAR